ncbi:hypothetical protein [Streptomyces sp. TLI_171]|uniref:hypothetical protein n=1 Tax=Streptomyces sp. TLI_171 TaxID=1938859 RepID=UPI000C1936AC|nr:hypothetical protein [Streptomyces sp. TLI_171]RKE16837.1 hypothetical protein BX266_0079 [Streptomyces sp. TLI_171]
MKVPDAPGPLHEFATWAPLLSAAAEGGPAVLTGYLRPFQGRTLATVRAEGGRSPSPSRTLDWAVPDGHEILFCAPSPAGR